MLLDSYFAPGGRVAREEPLGICDDIDPCHRLWPVKEFCLMNQEAWRGATAAIYSCGWEDTPWRVFSFRSLGGLFSGRYVVVYSYTVDGNHYSGEFYSSTEWEQGANLPILYNPENPEESGVDDGESPIAAAAGLLFALLLVGLGLWLKFRK